MAGLCQDAQDVLQSINASSLDILHNKLQALVSPMPLEAPLYTSDLGAMDCITTKGTSFLHLPGEIRNHIYHLVLIHPSCPPRRSTHNLVPNLLSTCRQITQEATPILYSLNTFTAHPSLLTSMPYLHSPTRPLYTPGLHTRIRRWRIQIRLDCDARFTEEDVTKAFTGCEELEIEAKEAMFRGAGNAVLMLFAGVRAVKSARVIGSVDREFAEWLEESMESVIGTPCVERDVSALVRKEAWGDNVGY